MLFKLFMYTFIGFVVGGMFFQFGNDGSRTIFNYGFMFITIIVFMYTPLMPVLLKCEFYILSAVLRVIISVIIDVVRY